MTTIHEHNAPNREIRAAVEYEIGAKNMQDFELWAFNSSPAQYEEAAFMFLKNRSTKYYLSTNNIEAIAQIIHLWKHRNDWKLGGW